MFPITKEYKLKCVNKLVNASYTHKRVNYTVKTFCANYGIGTYIVLVNKHALVIKDGIVIDNGDMRFSGYRRVVESYIKVS